MFRNIRCWELMHSFITVRKSSHVIILKFSPMITANLLQILLSFLSWSTEILKVLSVSNFWRMNMTYVNLEISSPSTCTPLFWYAFGLHFSHQVHVIYIEPRLWVDIMHCLMMYFDLFSFVESTMYYFISLFDVKIWKSLPYLSVLRLAFICPRRWWHIFRLSLMIRRWCSFCHM